MASDDEKSPEVQVPPVDTASEGNSNEVAEDNAAAAAAAATSEAGEEESAVVQDDAAEEKAEESSEPDSSATKNGDDDDDAAAAAAEPEQKEEAEQTASVDEEKTKADETIEFEEQEATPPAAEEETSLVADESAAEAPEQVEEALKDDSASKAEDEEMGDIESGLVVVDDDDEDKSNEITDTSKGSAAGVVTETASAVSSSSSVDRDIDKDSNTEGSQASDPQTAKRTRSQASGISQVFALIRKNLLTKFRTPGATFFELFSPVLMMLILSAAYTLTEIVDMDAAMYSSINLSFPGPWVNLFQRSTDLFGTNSNLNITNAIGRRRKLKQRQRELARDDPNLLVQMAYNEDDDDEPKTWDGIFEGLQQKMEKLALDHTHELVSDEMEQNHNRRLQQFRNRVDTSADAEAQSYALLDDALDELRDLLEGPIPTPSFSQFVAVSTALSNVIPLDSLPRVFAETSFGRQWGNLLTLGTLHLSPRNQAAEDFWAYLNETYPLTTLATSGTNFSNFRVRIHDTEASALNYIDATNKEERTWALLDFSNFDLEAESSAFEIRMNYTTVPNVNRITRWASVGLNSRYQRYYLSGYMTLQRTVNEYAMARSGCAQDVSSIMSMPMPTAAYSQNPFFTQVGYLLGLTMAMAFLYPTSRFIKTLVEEKESKMKETLLILGVRAWAHWMSWFFTALVVFFIITLTVSLTLSSTVLMHSDPAYLFLYVFLFSTSTIGFCFMVASFFSRAKLAAIIGPIALFATLLPRFVFFGSNRYENVTGQVLASLCPATAFCFGADIIADYEYAEQGIQSYNAGEGGYSFNTTLGMLFFDTLLYIFLGWYLEQVIPQQYGVARPFYFLFLPSYWLGECVKKDAGNVSIAAEKESESPDVEAVKDTSLVPKVQISGLVKQYFKGKTAFPPAVDGLDLTMYESQITALLGHNGAGKTTTVSVLTGLFPPTSGDCVLYGKSIVHSKQEARQSLGICPQHNILFDELTVYEHLAFFMRIKGLEPEKEKILGHAGEIGLSDYLGTASKALSGGNKRKLSVAIALSGDPDVLILDEPTSAMDPHSRRAVWELLRAKKKGRVTLLTTHFMDEAELLSDRVAVMKGGKLKCCGSPIFLKERFGLGYSLTLVLEPPASDGDDEEGGPANAEINRFLKQRDNISTFLNQRIPNTTIVRTSGKEVTFRFPQGSEAEFPTVFDDIEINKEQLGVGAYGIQNSSLEEVFLQLAESTDEESEAKPAATETSHTGVYDGDYSHLTPLRQIGLLYGKRLTIQRRDKKGACFAIVLPVLVVALVLVILMLEPPYIGGTLEMSPAMFQTSSGGESNAATNVAVSDRLSTSADLDDVSEATGQFMEGIKSRYGNIEFTADTKTDSAMGLSQFLLETYNNRDHATRFGAVVLNDVVNFTIKTDGSSISSLLETSIQNVSFGSDDNEINLIPLFGLGDENGNLNVALNLTDLPALVSDFGMMLPNITLNVPELSGIVEQNLNLMLLAANSTNLSLAMLDEYLEKTYYSLPDIEPTLPPMEPIQTIEPTLPPMDPINQTTSVANINATGTEDSMFIETNLTLGNESAASVGSKILQIDPIDLVAHIQSFGPFDRTALIESIDSFLPDVFESLGFQTPLIPNGFSLFRLLDNITAQLGSVDYGHNESMSNGTFVENGTFYDDSTSNKTSPGHLDFFNGGGFGQNLTIPNGSIEELLNSTALSDLLNGTSFDQLLNGTIISELFNGTSIDEVLNGTAVSELLNGTSIDQLLNATMISELLNGTSIDQLVNGTMISELLNGTSIDQILNGETISELLNGTSIDQLINGTIVSELLNGTSIDQLLNGTTIDQILNGTALDQLLNGTTIDQILNGTVFDQLLGFDFDYMDRLNTTDPEQLSNAIAIASTVIFRESLSEVAGTNVTISFADIFDDILSSVGFNGTLSSFGLPLDFDDLFDIKIQATNITLQPSSLKLNIYNLTLNVNEEPPIFLPFASYNLLDVGLESLGPMIPEEFVVPINAQASILHNTTSAHAVTAFNQAYMEYLYGQCKASSTVRLKSVNSPLPVTTQQSIEIRTVLSIVAALFLLIPYCYIPGAFTVFTVKERITKSKHLQLVSGVNMTAYWFATYLWDMSLFLVLTLLTMGVFLSYGNNTAAVFVGDAESFFATAVMTFGYGLSILPFSYLLARNFNNPSTAQISVIGLVFVTGFVAVNAYFLMTALEDTRDLAESLLPLFRLWPAFNIGEGFIELSSAYWEREVLFSEKHPFDWEVTGRSIALLYGLAPAYMVILLFLEYADDGGSGGLAGRVLRYIRGTYDRTMLSVYGVRKVGNKLTLDDGLVELLPNDDVQKEAEFVKEKPNLHESSPIVLRDLWKIYPPSIGLVGGLIKRIQWLLCCCGLGSSSSEEESEGAQSGPRRAVRGLSAAVQRGETFGLLGANGAGKTTTLGMLTGDIAATGGEAYVAGHDITGATAGGVKEARKNIGFCPQIDPLLGLMTGRETLRMFARLRGIASDKIDDVVTALLERLTLTPHADKTADSYSGGNKRKLSLGIAALVADGGVLLIDECSSGLDPLARRKLWGLIEKLALERSVVITTHSMEEAEALCSRIGIMARGQFVALGTVQHLKTKHLDGYTVDISCAPNSSQDTIDSVVDEICNQVIPGSVISERYGRFLKFEVNKVSTIGLGTTFKRLQELKESRGVIENYSIAQCSLEQVFIKLAKEADEAHHASAPTIAST